MARNKKIKNKSGHPKNKKCETDLDVLPAIIFTCPVCQVERSPLKAAACSNTAPHSNKEKSKDKMGWKKKEERALYKNRISAATERRREI